MNSDAEPVLPKTRIWPLLLGLGLVALAGGSFVLWHFLQPVTGRVLVAVDFNGYAWRGSKRAQAINELVAKRLSELGFETVDDDAATRAVLKDAASPEQAAQKLRAAYVVRATLSPRMIRHEVAKGYFEGRVQGPVELVYRGESPVKQSGEIVHYAFSTQTLTQLTKNRVRDRYPMFSPDGKRIYFESIGEDPNFPRTLGVSVIASVKAP
jgi:WD40-like Beta Propeller Repeat